LGAQRPAEQLHDLVRDFARQRVRRLAAGAQHGEYDYRLAFELVRDADRCGLEYRRVRRGRRLDLRGTDALPGYFQRVVAPAVDVPESVIVDPGPVAVDPDVGDASPVRRQVVLGGVPEAPRHARPRLPHDELAHRAAHGTTTLVDYIRRDAGHGAEEGRRLDRRPGRTAEQSPGYLGAAGVIHERRAPFARYPEVPPPRLGIPRLAGGAEHEGRRPVVTPHAPLGGGQKPAEWPGPKPGGGGAVSVHGPAGATGVRVVRRSVRQQDPLTPDQPAGDEPGPHHP